MLIRSMEVLDHKITFRSMLLKCDSDFPSPATPTFSAIFLVISYCIIFYKVSRI